MKQQAFVSNTSGLDYELIDCGGGRKLERFGNVILDRPEINASSFSISDNKLWAEAHFKFIEKNSKSGEWLSLKNAPKQWEISCKVEKQNFKFLLELTKFKHLGLFPEQFENWKYMASKLNKLNENKKVLNLFAYTGAANIVAAGFGAKVTHIDSIKQITNWARKNAEINSLDTIRWIVEDARKFVLKSIKRGDLYQGIILDPPTFGLGAKREIWSIENDLGKLLKDVKKLLDPNQHFIILNTYSPTISGTALYDLIYNSNFKEKNNDFFKLGLKSNKGKKIVLGDLYRFSNI